MKPLEDAFSSEGFRRVVLPGIVLTIGLHPLIRQWLPDIQGLYGIGQAALAVTEVIAFGLAVSSAIQWIYYVYEGFRLPWVTALAGRSNKKLVANLSRLMREIQGDKEFDDLPESQQWRLYKLNERLIEYPLVISKDGYPRRKAERPTRLGNIIATYELYAESRYGIDGVDYWYHLLFLGSSDARKEFEGQYAFAENLVLTSFSGVIVALVHGGVLLGSLIGFVYPNWVVFKLASGPATSLVIALVGIAVWWAFYAAALPAHKDAGAMFRTVVDISMPAFADWTASMQTALSSKDETWWRELSEYLKNLEPLEKLKPPESTQ
ncbi:MAG: hypothetical protein WB676_04490 [Bryobacteraceae bacterium]